jgi:hypothetical protein
VIIGLLRGGSELPVPDLPALACRVHRSPITSELSPCVAAVGASTLVSVRRRRVVVDGTTPSIAYYSLCLILCGAVVARTCVHIYNFVYLTHLSVHVQGSIWFSLFFFPITNDIECLNTHIKY